ncbi:putative transient receptor potential cation channel subfamily M member 3-like [Penaeus vannamei]|uniref:Putative transient receptor potential cation channel subfamily M member 3-like n=1 Tax=Penaeus vannamei TaxID=6689 RepID=A0A3R7QP76_PENVA|nr:putative transient receptor potential cation channel subfamily M member 3-like [Penaeus vannamei]
MEQSSKPWDKLKDWSSSVWSRFDLMAVVLAFSALALRLIRSTFKWGRTFYAINTAFFYCRLFRMYHVNYHLGPKLVIFYRMSWCHGAAVIFILGYGIASQSLLHPSHYSFTFNVTEVGNIVESVILTPYWQMYGELLLDQIVGTDHETCHEKSCRVADSCLNQTQDCLRDCVCENPADYKWTVKLMLFVYLIIGNIMLLNLLIAIFTHVFDEVHENSMEIWKFEMYRLIREYEKKPVLVIPLVLVQHFWQFFKAVGRACCAAKAEEESTEYESDAMVTLRLIEKEATQAFLARIHAAEENSLQARVKRMSDKIDRVTKYIDQKMGMKENGKSEELQEMQKNKDGKTERLPVVSPRRKITLLPPMKDSSQKQKQQEGKNCKNDDDDGDVDEDEISDNEIESELAHLFDRVDSVSRTSTPLAGRRRLNELQIYDRMNALERKLNAYQSSVTLALEKILDAFDEMKKKTTK